MQIKRTTLPGVLLVEPKIFADHRGRFLEAHRTGTLRDAGIDGPFVQSNISTSVAWTLRGLHYQSKDPQGKLVRCLSGEIYDVAVDMRASSPTFGKWCGARLDEFTLNALWVPPGFAHGFLVMGRYAVVHYECTSYYVEKDNHTLKWDDPDVGVTWPTMNNAIVISNKDRAGRSLGECEPVA